MSKAFVSTARANLVSTAIAFAFCVLIGRLFYLQVLEQKALQAHVQENRKMVQVVEARRGNIVDTNGNLLATTHTTIDLGVDPQAVQEEDLAKIPDLARLIGRSVDDLHNLFETKVRRGDSHQQEVRLIRWASLKKELDEATYRAVMELGIRGVYGNRRYSRTYPGGTLAAHVLGFVNKEETPVTGIERFFDFYLRGQDGWRETERDGRRRELVQFRNREVMPTNGLNIELSLDQMIQHLVEREIENLVKEFNPKSVSILVSEPVTGALLAMANHPTYDPNEFFNTRKYPLENQRNRALTDVFEPGSTFKIVPAAAALNEGIVSPLDQFTTGLARVEYRGRTVRLPSDHRTYDVLSVHDIMVKSSNRGVAHLGMLLGEKRLHDYAAAFGFGNTTGLSLGGEVSGTLHPVRNWDGLTITRLPMGHAISATPMQIHTATSVIANKGILMEPLLVHRIFDQNGVDVVSFAPKAKRRVVTSTVAETIASMLVEAVSDSGTARRAVIDGYSVAGKTGTTQKIINGRYSHQHHVASFSGFFPANQPALVITVVVDEPQMRGTGYGGAVAAPAFRNIAEACIAYLGIRPSRSDPAFLALENSSYYDRSRRISN